MSNTSQHCQHTYLTVVKIFTCRDPHHLIVLLLQTFNNQHQTSALSVIITIPTNQATIWQVL